MSTGGLNLHELASLDTPDATQWRVAPRSDGFIYYKGNDAVEHQLAVAVAGITAVTAGGTGRATGTNAYALVATGTTPTGAQQTLGVGATTDILVGGGAAAIPAWTASTGTGSPVRRNKPTLDNPAVAGVLFANLPTPVAGMTAYITDSTTNTWGATIAGTGGNAVLGWYNGSNWTVIGK